VDKDTNKRAQKQIKLVFNLFCRYGVSSRCYGAELRKNRKVCKELSYFCSGVLFYTVVFLRIETELLHFCYSLRKKNFIVCNISVRMHKSETKAKVWESYYNIM